MITKIKLFWQQISDKDRRMIRWTLLVCAGILSVSFVALILYVKFVPSVAVDDLELGDSNAWVDTESENLEVGLADIPPLPGGEIFASLDSFNNSAHKELAKIYLERRLFSKSLLHAERIAPWMEEDLEFQGQIGSTYLQAGRPHEAIAPLELALQKHRDNAELWADLALARFRGMQGDSGISTIEKAMEKFPNNPLLLTHRAAMLGEVRHRNATGEKIFQNLLKQFPNYAPARYQFGRFLMNQSNFGSAYRQLLAAQKLDPFDSRIHARIGMAQFYLGRDKEAEKSYKTALAMNSLDYNTWFNLGELYLSLAYENTTPSGFKAYTRLALEAYLTTLAHQPEHYDAHYRVGSILNINKQNREAILH